MTFLEQFFNQVDSNLPDNLLAKIQPSDLRTIMKSLGLKLYTDVSDKATGFSAYQVWLQQPGNEGKTETEYLESLKRFRFRGAWQANTAYTIDDLVENGGNIYQRLTNGTSGSSFSGVGSNWSMFLPGAAVSDGAVTRQKLDSVVKGAIDAVLPPVSDIVGVSAPGVGNNSTATNRTRIDNLFPISGTGSGNPILKQVAVYCTVAGTGKVKFVRKNATPGSYTILKEFSYDFVAGLNTITTATFGSGFELETGCYAAFFSATAAFAVTNGSANSSFQLSSTVVPTELTESTNPANVSSSTAALQFNVVVETVSNKVVALDGVVTALQGNVNSLQAFSATAAPTLASLTTTTSTLNNTIFGTVQNTVGVTTIGTANASSSSNRTRIDNLYPITGSGTGNPILKQIRVHCAAAGAGKVKFVRKTGTAGVYTILKEFAYTFVEGLNTITTATFGTNYELEPGCYIAFFSTTALFTVINGVAGNSYQFNSGELLTGSVSSSGTAVIQFQVDVETVGNTISRMQGALSQIEATGIKYPDMFYSWEVAGNGANKGAFNVYTKLKGNQYLRHRIIRETDLSDTVYQDYYRYAGCNQCTYENNAMTVGIALLTAQESECVWRRSDNRVDFTGGYHGDEIMTSIAFFVDGTPIDLSANIALKACSSAHYIEHSTMHETATSSGPIAGHPVDATHVKITTFLKNGYRTRNAVTWAKDVPISLFYGGICCVGRNLVKQIYTDKDYLLHDVDTYDNTLLGGTGLREYFAYNPDTHLSVNITSKAVNTATNYVDSAHILDVRDNGFPAQYKKYYRTPPAGTAKAGETWIAEMEVTIMMQS